jgi:hypothetical protein
MPHLLSDHHSEEGFFCPAGLPFSAKRVNGLIQQLLFLFSFFNRTVWSPKTSELLAFLVWRLLHTRRHGFRGQFCIHRQTAFYIMKSALSFMRRWAFFVACVSLETHPARISLHFTMPSFGPVLPASQCSFSLCLQPHALWSKSQIMNTLFTLAECRNASRLEYTAVRRNSQRFVVARARQCNEGITKLTIPLGEAALDSSSALRVTIDSIGTHGTTK